MEAACWRGTFSRVFKFFEVVGAGGWTHGAADNGFLEGGGGAESMGRNGMSFCKQARETYKDCCGDLVGRRRHRYWRLLVVDGGTKHIEMEVHGLGSVPVAGREKHATFGAAFRILKK